MSGSVLSFLKDAPNSVPAFFGFSNVADDLQNGTRLRPANRVVAVKAIQPVGGACDISASADLGCVFKFAVGDTADITLLSLRAAGRDDARNSKSFQHEALPFRQPHAAGGEMQGGEV